MIVTKPPKKLCKVQIGIAMMWGVRWQVNGYLIQDNNL